MEAKEYINLSWDDEYVIIEQIYANSPKSFRISLYQEYCDYSRYEPLYYDDAPDKDESEYLELMLWLHDRIPNSIRKQYNAEWDKKFNELNNL